jgi:LCP family protein required for cell wall assembly
VSRSLPARRPDPRAAAAAFLSFVLPGLGQGYNGQWLLAIVLAVPVLLVVGLGIGLAAGADASLLSRLVDTRVLLALLVLDLALLGWRLVAIVQAHLARARLSLRSWTGMVTALLLLATLGMHALPAVYAAKAIDTLDSVALEGGGTLFDERQGRDVVIPEPSDQPEVRIGERVTILFVGIDFAPGRDNHLTDTMLVATLDPDTGRAAMVSVPRDLYGVPLGDGRVYNAKLNSLLATASADAATYPLGGPATLKAAIGDLLGTKIHYIAAIDIEGMRQVVDTIGGVDVVVEKAIDDPQYPDPVTGGRGFFLPAGPQHLDGAMALGFARSRKSEGESDFTRAARQQQLLAAIADKLTAGNLIGSLPGLLDAAKRNLATDIPSARMSAIAAAVQDANLDAVERVVLTPDEGYVTIDAFSAAGYILHPNLDAIRALADRLFGTGRAGAPTLTERVP